MMEEHCLVHAAKRQSPSGDKASQYLFLRKDGGAFRWYLDEGKEETPTEITAPTVEKAMTLAYKTWSDEGFRPVLSGFRYTLPERDEHGAPALFYQLAASEKSFNGAYLDDTLGHMCFIQGASQEARNLYRRLKGENRL